MQSQRLGVGRFFAIGNALIAVSVVIAAVRIGPQSLIVHVGSALLALLLLWSSFGLLRATPWRLLALRACAWVGLAIGVAGLVLLAVAAGAWSGQHSGLASRNVLSPMLGLALLLPYLLLYPGVQLLWAHRQQRHAE